MKRFSVLFLFLILTIPIGAHADVVLFDNMVTQTTPSFAFNLGNTLGQSFKTDSSAYNLISVELYMSNPGGGTGLLSIYTNESNLPGSWLGDLTSPTSFTSSYGVNTFTTGGISLSANSEYWVVLGRAIGTNSLNWAYTSLETGTGVGYSNDTAYIGPGNSNWATLTAAHQFEMKVNADPVTNAVPEPATLLFLGFGLFGAGVAGRKIKK